MITIRRDDGIGSDKIFVYDHLKYKGRENNVLVSIGCSFVGKATLKGFAMYSILQSYPIIIPTVSLKHEIIGEIWKIGHAKLLETLDSLKSPMQRNLFDIEYKKEKFKIWTYFMLESQFNQDAPGVRYLSTGKWIL